MYFVRRRHTVDPKTRATVPGTVQYGYLGGHGRRQHAPPETTTTKKRRITSCVTSFTLLVLRADDTLPE